MKHPNHSVEQVDIDYAMNPTPWDLGNKVLYDMCAAYSQHETPAEAISKVWLIGRSYAAAIERRKNKQEDSDDFYEKTVGPGVCNSRIDDVLSNMPASPADPVLSVADTVRAHWTVNSLFQSLAHMGKRSLAAKYLHFHRPDIFFIYDSRAQTAISKLTPDCRYIECVSLSESERDELYYKFCMRACWLRRHVEESHGHALTPRQLDKVLLNAQRRIGSATKCVRSAADRHP